MSNEARKAKAFNRRDRRRAEARPSQASAAHRGRNEADARAHAKRSYERYMELARAAVSAGDAIEGENLFQHAEHYFRAMREHEGGRDDRNDGIA
jgi:hypothetical protein